MSLGKKERKSIKKLVKSSEYKAKSFNSAASKCDKETGGYIDQHDGSAVACSHAAVSVEMKPGAFQPRSAAHADSTAISSHNLHIFL